MLNWIHLTHILPIYISFKGMNSLFLSINFMSVSNSYFCSQLAQSYYEIFLSNWTLRVLLNIILNLQDLLKPKYLIFSKIFVNSKNELIYNFCCWYNYNPISRLDFDARKLDVFVRSFLNLNVFNFNILDEIPLFWYSLQTSNRYFGLFLGDITIREFKLVSVLVLVLPLW